MKSFACSLSLLAIACLALAAQAASVSLPGYEPQGPYIDTIRFLRLALKEPRFWNRGDVHAVNVRPDAPRTRLHYKVWMQKQPAPLVIILPGLGGHYANLAPSVLAETIHRQGMSALLVSSTFNWEFVLNGSSVAAPGFTPVDAQDLYRALQLIVNDATNRYRRAQPTQLMLLGFSLGALNALYLAELDQGEQRLGFSRILAVNPPVNLVYALHQLDQFYSIWTNWSAAELEQRKNKAVAIYNSLFDRFAPKPTNGFLVPIDDDEAKFAIGYTFRRALGETIKAIHSRTNFGILSTPYKSSKTRFLDKEIEHYGYYDYVMSFVRKAHPDAWQTLQDLNQKASLWRIQPTLARDPRILVLHTRNDFLLSDLDRDWLASVLRDRILFFDEGGHLGNLYRQEVQDVIAHWLAGEPVPALTLSSPASFPPVRAETVAPTPAPAPAFVRAEPVTAAAPVRVEAVVPAPAPAPAAGSQPAADGIIPVTGIIRMDGSPAPAPAAQPATRPASPAKPAAPSAPAATPAPPPPSQKSPTVEYYEQQADKVISGPREDMVIEYYEED